MFKKIKYILYRKGYLSLNSISDKIDYLKTININPYNSKYMRVNMISIERDIVTYTHVFDMLLREDFVHSRVNVKKITENVLHNTTLIHWFSNNGHYVDNINELFSIWLTYAQELVNMYDASRYNSTNAVMVGNSIKIQPYIINIENIVDTILETI